MKKSIPSLLILFILLSCSEKSPKNTINVGTPVELSSAILAAKPGDHIIMANGIWKDVQIEFTRVGTEENPITLKAETEGEVFIEGVSNLTFGGEYLVN